MPSAHSGYGQTVVAPVAHGSIVALAGKVPPLVGDGWLRGGCVHRGTDSRVLGRITCIATTFHRRSSWIATSSTRASVAPSRTSPAAKPQVLPRTSMPLVTLTSRSRSGARARRARSRPSARSPSWWTSPTTATVVLPSRNASSSSCGDARMSSNGPARGAPSLSPGAVRSDVDVNDIAMTRHLP